MAADLQDRPRQKASLAPHPTIARWQTFCHLMNLQYCNASMEAANGGHAAAPEPFLCRLEGRLTPVLLLKLYKWMPRATSEPTVDHTYSIDTLAVRQEDQPGPHSLASRPAGRSGSGSWGLRKIWALGLRSWVVANAGSC